MKKLIFILLLFNTSDFLFSQNEYFDSLKTYRKDDVIISATREEILRKNSPSIIKILSETTISEMSGSRLSEKLKQVNGIFLKDYGPGGLKTISLRGLGPEHCLVLFNGEKLNSSQNGNVDLSNYMTEDIERIEILKGGNSAYFGSEALAGIVNIIPKSSSGKFSIKTLLSTGSFDYYKYFFKVENKIGNLELNASYNQEKAGNDFEFRFDDNSDIYKGKRKNADFINRQFQMGLNYKISTFSSINLFNTINYSDKGIPDIIISPNYTARQKDDDIISILVYKNKIDEYLDIKVTPSFHYSKLDYINPKLDTEQKKYISNSNNYIFGINNQIRYLYSNFDLSGGLEALKSISNSNNYSGEKDRFQIGTFLSSALNIQNTLLPVIIYPALRYDHYSDFGSSLSPKIGVNIKLANDDLIFKTSFSSNFRAPTFNELFWNPGGNPSLKPEKSNSYDLGINFKTEFPFTSAYEISYFITQMDNRIIWLPSGGFIWEPRNVQSVKSTGFEASADYYIFDNTINFGFNYSYINSQNRTNNDYNYGKFLPYVPNHAFKSSLGLNINKIKLNLFYCLTGERYSSESNEKTSLLPYYHYLDGSLSYEIKVLNTIMNFKIEINNIFNSEYVIMPYYPTALRNYKLNISIKI